MQTLNEELQRKSQVTHMLHPVRLSFSCFFAFFFGWDFPRLRLVNLPRNSKNYVTTNHDYRCNNKSTTSQPAKVREHRCMEFSMASFAAVQALHSSWGGRPIVDGRVRGGDLKGSCKAFILCEKFVQLFFGWFFGRRMPEKNSI